MIIAQAPMRIPLGGGSTDLPSYYEKFGGFIFGVAINLCARVILTYPVTDDKIRVNYSNKEVVDKLSELKHNIAREIFRHQGIKGGIEVFFAPDVSGGSGLGGSNSAAVA